VAGFLEGLAGKRKKRSTDPLAFVTGGNEQRPNLAIAWITGGKAQDHVVFYHTHISDRSMNSAQWTAVTESGSENWFSRTAWRIAIIC
jgi:hypothetical protein